MINGRGLDVEDTVVGKEVLDTKELDVFNAAVVVGESIGVLESCKLLQEIKLILVLGNPSK